MITEDYISFETAKLLKEKGFDEPCYAYWHEDENRLIFSYSMHAIRNITNPCFFGPAVPTLQMTMKWLREVHYCHIVVDYTFKADAGLTNDYVSYVYGVENAKTFVQHTSDRFFDTYEESCEAAIKYCLENLT